MYAESKRYIHVSKITPLERNPQDESKLFALPVEIQRQIFLHALWEWDLALVVFTNRVLLRRHWKKSSNHASLTGRATSLMETCQMARELVLDLLNLNYKCTNQLCIQNRAARFKSPTSNPWPKTSLYDKIEVLRIRRFADAPFPSGSGGLLPNLKRLDCLLEDIGHWYEWRDAGEMNSDWLPYDDYLIPEAKGAVLALLNELDLRDKEDEFDPRDMQYDFAAVAIPKGLTVTLRFRHSLFDNLMVWFCHHPVIAYM